MAKNVHSYYLIPLYDIGSETWPLWKTDQKYLGSLEMQHCRKIRKIS
jgi:hypothetical protein